jgi:hypothetical protein
LGPGKTWPGWEAVVDGPNPQAPGNLPQWEQDTPAWDSDANIIKWTLSTDSSHAIAGRDYFDGTCMPGYTPYTYPHPLTGFLAQPINLNCSNIPGDVDGDGRVTAADAALVSQALAGKITLTAAQQSAAEVDGESSIDSNDVQQILDYAAGKITSFTKQ